MQKSGHLALEQAAPHPEKSYHNMEVARSRATGARHPEYDNSRLTFVLEASQ